MICEIDTMAEFPNGLIEILGRKAKSCWLNSNDDRFFIEFVDDIPADDESNYREEITCPHCGAEESDSWEYSDSEDDRECGTCGSVFSYHREIEVTYSSKIVKRNDEILTIEAQGEK